MKDVSLTVQVMAIHNLTRVYIVIVKASSGPRYVVSYRPALPVSKVCFFSYICFNGSHADKQLPAESRCPSVSRHDYVDDHANPATGS